MHTAAQTNKIKGKKKRETKIEDIVERLWWCWRTNPNIMPIKLHTLANATKRLN
jgi:hypothetical protein